MRGPLTGLLATIALVVAAPVAAVAETVVATDSAEIYLKPGESSKVVVKVKSGQEMTVLRRDGRWIKVRVRGRTGFIPRTKVSGGEAEASEDDVERQTRRRPYVDGRSTDRGWGGEPPDDRRGVDAVDNIDPSAPPSAEEISKDPEVKPTREVKAPREAQEPKEARQPKPRGGEGDVVVKIEEPTEPRRVQAEDTDRPRELARKPAPKRAPSRERQVVQLDEAVALRAKPGAKSKKIATAEAGEVSVLEERGGWSKIETDTGERGWLSTKLLVSEAAAPAPRRVIAATAQLGFTYLVQGTRTTGGPRGVPDNYNLSTFGGSLTVGAGATFPVARAIQAGLQAQYSGTKAKPFRYQNQDTGITTHAVDIRALGGYSLGNRFGMVAWGRLGYHYDMFSVDNVTNLTKNTAKLPSENLSGGTLGAAFTVDRLTRKIGLSVGLDALVFSTRQQTKNLEDGDSPSTSGMWLTVAGVYHLTRSTNVDLGYRLTYLNNSFGAPKAESMRGHTGTSVSRTDVVHLVGLGVNQAF